jgi:hypothetical protein
MAGMLGENLISYEKVIEFLATKGKEKNFFNTLRSRHKLIHKPIIRPPVDFSIKEMNIKIRQGRSVYYLREIIPYLEKIIRLNEKDDLTFNEIEERMQPDKRRLEKLRELELADDKRLKPAEFIDLFKVATIKLQQYIGWTDSSKEKSFLEHVSKERLACGKRYYELTNMLREEAQRENGGKTNKIEFEREAEGRKLDFYHQIMDTIVEQFKSKIKEGKIKMMSDDWRDVMRKMTG